MKYRASSLGIDLTAHKNELGFRVMAASVMLLYLALLHSIYVPYWDFVPTSTFSNSSLLHVSVVLGEVLLYMVRNMFWIYVYVPVGVLSIHEA